MIAVADLRAACNAGADEDAYITQLLASAVAYINESGGRYFGAAVAVTENIIWRGGTFQLASEPTGAVVFTQFDGSAWGAVDSTAYVVDGRLVFPGAFTASTSAVHLRAVYTAGYATTDAGVTWAAPADIKQAVRMLVAHWFLNREGETSVEVKEGINMVLRKYR